MVHSQIIIKYIFNCLYLHHTYFRQPIQNVPIPLKYPKELDQGLWGGEAVIAGFVKRHQRCRRIPHYWVPQLYKTVVYSEILNKYMRMTVTQRAMDLIHDNYGLDYYILKVYIINFVKFFRQLKQRAIHFFMVFVDTSL